MEKNELREQYQSLTLKQLEIIRINAVLEKDAKDILMAVILEKMKDGGAADAIHQIQRDEEDKQNFNSKLKEKHQLAVKSKDISLLDEDEIKILTKNIILTTETFVADLSIEERLEIITAECVYGMNVFRDFFASMTDFFGGRSKASQKVLRDARKVCLSELKKEALLVGADAVVGVDLDYSEISGGGKAGMLLLVASGTAVRLKQS